MGMLIQSPTYSQVLLDLAARPEYIAELREEIEAVLAEDGEELDENGQPFIRKSSFAKMRKLDSFIRESQRFNGLGFGVFLFFLPFSSMTPPCIHTSLG